MKKLTTLLTEVFHVNESDYSDTTELISFNEWDSMTHMLFITRLEETFNIQLDGDDIAGMQSIGQIKDVLRKYGIE